MGWQEEMIPEDLTADRGGQPVSAREFALIKESPDFPSFVKRAIDRDAEVGRRVPLPNGAAKPEDIDKWRTEHLSKFVKAGLIPTPPELPGEPGKYEVKYQNEHLSKIVKPELIAALQETAHKHGLTQAAVAELTALNEQQFAGLFEVIQANKEKSVAAVEHLATDFNKPAEQLMAVADNWLTKAGYTQEQQESLKAIGLLMDAPVLDLIVRAAMNSGESEGLLGEGPAAQPGNDAAAEANDIIRNKANPKYAAYHKGDPDVNAHVQQLLKKGIPGTVEI